MILIPMAGLSSRFAKAGYVLPKFMLEAHGETLFEYSIKSFKRYFDTLDFVFVCSKENCIVNFVENKITALGIKNSLIVTVDKPTRGQAETVYIGLKKYLLSKKIQSNMTSLTIFNIDTFRPNFEFPSLEAMGDGYLEVFEGEGSNWSFARADSDESTIVVETAEKNEISNLCSTGLYYFRNSDDYITSFEQYINLPPNLWEKGELYISPLYNSLIKSGREIHYNKILRKDVTFCGIPDEYLQFLSISHVK